MNTESRGAHATRVLARRPAERTFSRDRSVGSPAGFGGSPKPARGSRALPGSQERAFTLVELLIVMAIIIVLAGLILGTSGYIQKKGARSRAEAEISAMSAALESYKADNGIYPRGNADPTNTTEPYDTDKLNARVDLIPAGKDRTKYETASKALYVALSGDTNGNRAKDATEADKSYFTFKPNMLSPTDQAKPVTGLRDPFGDSYGYSTAYAYDLQQTPSSTPTRGYNPTFDLWSTGGTTGNSAADTVQWVKNW